VGKKEASKGKGSDRSSLYLPTKISVLGRKGDWVGKSSMKREGQEAVIEEEEFENECEPIEFESFDEAIFKELMSVSCEEEE